MLDCEWNFQEVVWSYVPIAISRASRRSSLRTSTNTPNRTVLSEICLSSFCSYKITNSSHRSAGSHKVCMQYCTTRTTDLRWYPDHILHPEASATLRGLWLWPVNLSRFGQVQWYERLPILITMISVNTYYSLPTIESHNFRSISQPWKLSELQKAAVYKSASSINSLLHRSPEILTLQKDWQWLDLSNLDCSHERYRIHVG